jgi:hypothetical protein
MRPAQGFPANEPRRQRGANGQDLLPSQPLLHDHMPLGIDAMYAHAMFCDIDVL